MWSATALRALALASILIVAGSAGSAAAAADTTTTIRISLQPDGDAHVTVTARFPIETENGTEGFDRLAEEFEGGEAAALSADPFRRAAELAAASTGRSMSIRNVSRKAGRANGTGRLVLSFVWTSFARTNGDRMVLGDVFRTPSGTWLPELADHQELVIEFPDRYDVVSSSRGLDNGSFHVRGPEELEPGKPHATLERRSGATAATTGDNVTRTEAPRRGVLPAVGGGAVLVALALLVYLLWRRRDTGEGAVAGGGGGDEPPGTTATGGDPGTDEDGGQEPPGGGAAAEPGDGELLSDEERVLRLLYENEGRMKQADIVTETDWSNAKVSQLLSEMDEEGRIEKLRIGRENLISLPGEMPDEAE